MSKPNETELKKAAAKATAARRAQLALRHQMERIDMHYDVIMPMRKEILAGDLVINLDESDVIEIEGPSE